MNVLVIGAKQNQYTTKAGQVVQTASLTILQEFPDPDSPNKGYDAFDVEIPFSDRDKHQLVPAFYDVDLGVSNSYGRLVASCKRADFLKSVALTLPSNPPQKQQDNKAA